MVSYSFSKDMTRNYEDRWLMTYTLPWMTGAKQLELDFLRKKNRFLYAFKLSLMMH